VVAVYTAEIWARHGGTVLQVIPPPTLKGVLFTPASSLVKIGRLSGLCVVIA
jgi:hypothetical protein